MQNLPQRPELRAPEQFDWVKGTMFFFPNTVAHVKNYHCLEMTHPLADGVQRVRCYPFQDFVDSDGEIEVEGHQFHDRNLTDAVFLLPVNTEDRDDFVLPRDKEHLQYAKVLLLFQIRVRGNHGRPREEDCAFIQYLDKYLVKGMYMCTVVSGCCAVVFCCVLFYFTVYCLCPEMIIVMLQKKEETSWSVIITQGSMNLHSRGLMWFQLNLFWGRSPWCQIFQLEPFHTG